MTEQPNIDARLPLPETTLLILLSLARHPRHGYAIMKDVQALSDGPVTPSTGTLYGALQRLLEPRWIERAGEPSRNTTGLFAKSTSSSNWDGASWMARSPGCRRC